MPDQPPSTPPPEAALPLLLDAAPGAAWRVAGTPDRAAALPDRLVGALVLGAMLLALLLAGSIAALLGLVLLALGALLALPLLLLFAAARSVEALRRLVLRLRGRDPSGRMNVRVARRRGPQE